MTALREVSVAIVSWNGLEHLKVCLEALRAQQAPGVPWEVLVLDNGSSDGSSAWISTHGGPRVRLITSPVNLGFCAGNNRLVEAARGDAVAFLNNDTRPHPRWLATMVEALRAASADVAAVSGTILDWSGERLDFGSGILTFDGHAFQRDYHRPLAEVKLPVTGSELLFPCGGNMLVRRRSFQEAGGFDPSYFAYLEDVDLGWRLWAGGERVTFVAEALAYHRSMATSELLGRYNRGFLFERNAFLTAHKNYEAGWWEKMMPAILLTLLSRTQTLLVENNPGGVLLGVDPYAGAIANTAPGAAASSGSSPAVLPGKWRHYGARGFVRRGLERVGRWLLAGPGGDELPVLSDGRSLAQVQVLSYLLRHLEAAAADRAAAQARRRVPDREIFARFPLYVVPTYPGDERLFSSAAFASWLPADVTLLHRRLDEVMALD